MESRESAIGDTEYDLRSDSETVGRVEQGFRAADDWLGDVDRFCAKSALVQRVELDARFTVDEAESGLVQAGSQAVRVDELATTVSANWCNNKIRNRLTVRR